MRSQFNASLFSLVLVRDDGRYLLVQELERDNKTAWYTFEETRWEEPPDIIKPWVED